MLPLPLALSCSPDTTTDGVRARASVTVGATYQLVRSGSNKCLDSTGSYAPLRQFSCSSGASESFRIDDAGGDAVRLINDASHSCVDVSSSGTANGTVIQLWDCNGTSAQSFVIEDQGGGTSRLRNTNSNKCLDVSGSSNADGAKVQLWSCNSTNAQKWTFNAVGGTPPPPPPDMGGGGPVGDCGSAGGAHYVEAYRSSLSRWCIDSTVYAAHAADFQRFYPYGDKVITTLETLFAHTPNGLPFTFQATVPTGGASTGSDFGLGDTVTGDAFWNDFQDPVTGQNISGFWGYLLALHEAINDWTGDVSPDWPTDWWADHRSPFPNSMDYHIMQVIGQENNDANLQAAATAQHERFALSSSGDYDTEVTMFDQLFDQFGGFGGFAHVFSLVQADGLDWSQVAPNPSALHSAYVIAFLQLGLGVSSDLTQSLFVAHGVGKLDTSVPSYSVDSNAVRGVGNAHCAIAAAKTDPGVSQSTINGALANLRSGNYSAALVTSHACQTSSNCPSECSCASGTHQCVARW
jgi:hypothetical protein